MQSTTLTVDPNVVLIITTLGGILTTLLSLWVQTYRENRKRAWEVEDRKLLAAELSNTKREIVERHEDLSTRIDRNANLTQENTQITKETMAKADAAYKEANSVNLKIAEISSIFAEATAAGNKEQSESNLRLDKLEEPIAATPEVVEKIEKIDKTTQATLKEVKKPNK